MSELLKMSLSEQGIKLEQIEVDFNKLFSLSYTFDNLKLIMNTLLENQNIMSTKINELEKIIKEQNDQSKNQINILEKKIKALSIKKEQSQIKNKQLYDFPIKKLSIEKEKSKEIKNYNILENINEIPPKKIEENKEKEKCKKEDIKINEQKVGEIKKNEDLFTEPLSGSRGDVDNFDEDDNPDFFLENEEIENLKQKFESLEQRINNIDKNSKFNPSKLLNQGGSSEDIQLLKLNIKSFQDKVNELNKEKENIKKDLEELKIKVIDFNIYELFKEMKEADGSVDTSN